METNTETMKKTIIVFSGEYDKMIAAFIIANGAAAMGDDVTMFFTFWGLNALRRPERVHVEGKSVLQRAFGAMMPRGADRLPMSRMNFAGAGPKLMKRAMRQQNAMQLDELIASAREQGVKFVACTMSMDVLGITADELVGDIEYAGVASYLKDADEANINLFI
jgi:peroxiredoxin family protein